MSGVTLVVDAANVVGSRPDGWWRDRPGAAARLVSRIGAALAAGTLSGPVLVVLEGAARRRVPEGNPATESSASGTSISTESSASGTSISTESSASGTSIGTGLRVVHAERDGDSAIVAEVAELVAGPQPAEVAVVTADRGLRARVLAEGATVLGPSWLLDRLPPAG